MYCLTSLREARCQTFISCIECTSTKPKPLHRINLPNLEEDVVCLHTCQVPRSTLALWKRELQQGRVNDHYQPRGQDRGNCAKTQALHAFNDWFFANNGILQKAIDRPHHGDETRILIDKVSSAALLSDLEAFLLTYNYRDTFPQWFIDAEGNEIPHPISRTLMVAVWSKRMNCPHQVGSKSTSQCVVCQDSP